MRTNEYNLYYTNPSANYGLFHVIDDTHHSLDLLLQYCHSNLKDKPELLMIQLECILLEYDNFYLGHILLNLTFYLVTFSLK